MSIWAVVSILVLMEVSFRHRYASSLLFEASRFNPCFNGSIFQTFSTHSVASFGEGFNPCFNGSIFQTLLSGVQLGSSIQVSILVLMEVSFRRLSTHWVASSGEGFNPCFNGSIFQTDWVGGFISWY